MSAIVADPMYDAILHSILDEMIASPGHDQHWLDYAEWLEVAGNFTDRDRAEFIRLQCEYAALSRPKTDDEKRHQQDLARRIDLLLRKNRAVWAAPVSGKGVLKIFRRGFLEEVNAPVLSFVLRSAAWFDPHPLLRSFTLRHAAGQCVQLAN